MKALIFDSGPLINFSMSGLLYLLEELKRRFQGKFFITEQVKYEVIDRPIKVPKFELGALMIKNLLAKKIIEFPSSLEIDSELIKKQTSFFMKKAKGAEHSRAKAKK